MNQIFIEDKNLLFEMREYIDKICNIIITSL